MSIAEGGASGIWKKRLRVAVLFVAFIALTVVIGAPMGLFSGTRPGNLGVHDGRLAPPKRTPNNVNSQIDRNADSVHYIEPLHYSGDAGQAWATLKRVVDGMRRVKVVRSEPDYLYVEFTSKLIGFVDDTEFYLDRKAGVIQVRSASRLGRGDHGVNRGRIDYIRAKLAKAKF